LVLFLRSPIALLMSSSDSIDDFCGINLQPYWINGVVLFLSMAVDLILLKLKGYFKECCECCKKSKECCEKGCCCKNSDSEISFFDRLITAKIIVGLLIDISLYIYFIVQTIQTNYEGWAIYECIGLKIFNSRIIVSLQQILIISQLKKSYPEYYTELYSHKIIIVFLGYLLALPWVFTHFFTGFFLYIWIILLYFIPFSLSEAYISILKKREMKIEMNIAMRFIILITLQILAQIAGPSYNYAYLYYSKHYSYIDVVRTDFYARSTADYFQTYSDEIDDFLLYLKSIL